jgi:hypothetical protein
LGAQRIKDLMIAPNKKKKIETESCTKNYAAQKFLSFENLAAYNSLLQEMSGGSTLRMLRA